MDEHSLFYKVYILYISLSIYCYSIIHVVCYILIFYCYSHRFCHIDMLSYSRLVIHHVTFSGPWIHHFFLPFSGTSFCLLLRNFDSNFKIYLWHVHISNFKYIKHTLFYIKYKVKGSSTIIWTVYSRTETSKKKYNNKMYNKFI